MGVYYVFYGTRVCIHVCVCVHVCVRACVRMCLHACVRTCVHVCVRACMRACVRMCLHVCVRACVRVCVCICCNNGFMLMYIHTDPARAFLCYLQGILSKLDENGIHMTLVKSMHLPDMCIIIICA